MTGLRLALSPSTATSFRVDWLRVYRAGTSATVSFPAGHKLYYTDGTTYAPMPCGGATAACTSGTADTSLLPWGTYRFYVDGTVATESSAVELDRTPTPVILDPDALGGTREYGSATHNAWDMATSSDVTKIGNASNVSFSGGIFSATNAGSHPYDPFFDLRLGTGGIDSREFHRFTITMSYDGPFNLANAPGGGTMGRLMWTRADKGSAIMQTQDWVTYSGVHTYQFDLSAPTSELNETTAGNRYPFVSPYRVTSLRWDPNEDPGHRRWHIYDVQLRNDDIANTAFAIRWTDSGHKAGTTVSLYYDTDRVGCNGKLIAAGVPQVAGTNSYTWNTSAVPAGKYWIYIAVNDGVQTTRTYANGPLVVSH